MKKPEVFISYSWDSEAHKSWVSNLALQLQQLGIKIKLDQSDAQLGDHIKSYMEKAINDSDFVIMIFTPPYKEKVKDQRTGSGFEYDLITKSLLIDPEENDKFIPVLREGTEEESIPDFMKAYMRVGMCENENYERGLLELYKRVNNVKQIIKKAQDMQDANGHIPPENIDVIKGKVRAQIPHYIHQVFGIKTNWSVKKKKEVCKAKLEEWEAEIQEYSDAFSKNFSLDLFDTLYKKSKQAFKQDVMKTLWTVGSALRDPSEELANYKITYNKCPPEKVFNCVNNILQTTAEYIHEKGASVNIGSLLEPEDLHHKFLDDEDMILTGVIGYGIRSEILHRSWPSHFSIMTRKTLWGMFFLSEQSLEFLRYETDRRKGSRLSNQYDYDYQRFNFYSATLCQYLEKYLEKFDLTLKKEYWMGYANLFLTAVSQDNYHLKRELNAWVK